MDLLSTVNMQYSACFYLQILTTLLFYYFSLTAVFVSFSALLNISLKTCCFMCTRLVYLEPLTAIKKAITQFYNTSHYSIIMPNLNVPNSDVYSTGPFVKLMDTPGVVYVHIDKSKEKYMDRTIGSLVNSLPLFAIILLLTAEGGLFIWLLVCIPINLFIALKYQHS